MHHEKFRGYSVGATAMESCCVVLYYDDNGELGRLHFDMTWATHVKYLYMKVCDMYDMGMSIEDIQVFYDL